MIGIVSMCRSARTLLSLALVGVCLIPTGCSVIRQGGESSSVSGPPAAAWPDVRAGGSTTARPGCDPFPGAPRPGGRFTVAAIDSVSSRHAPVPRNRAERLVFAQLYETLVRVDCAGNILPGLAVTWTCTPDSSTWVFTLRPGAKFWDGTPVTVPEVRESWRRAQTGCPVQGPRDPWTWLDAGAATVRAVDARRLSITLPEPQGNFPLLLAHPAFAVAGERKGWIWPVGSGPARLGPGTPQPLPDLECRPNRHHPRAPIWDALTFRMLPTDDPRDLVEAGCDLLPAYTLQDSLFYAALPGFTVTPLPATRSYLLLCPPHWNPAEVGRWSAPLGAEGLPAMVTSVTMGSWDKLVVPGPSPTACPQLRGPTSAPSAAPLAWHLADKKLGVDTLAYPTGDPAARQMAEYLAARLDQPVRLVPLEKDPLAFALQWQMTGAGILAVDQAYPTGCLQLASLIGSIGWLQDLLPHAAALTRDSLAEADRTSGPRPSAIGALTTGGAVRCLGITHAWLAIHGRPAGIRLAFDGTPWLEGWGELDAPPPPDVPVP